MLASFSIKGIVDAIVADNAPNIKLAAKLLNIPSLSCFAHTLNLVVQHAIAKSIKNLVDAAKCVVQLFKKSSHALSKLHEMQRNLNMEDDSLSKTAVLARIMLEAVHLQTKTPNLPESIRKLGEQLIGGLQKRFSTLETNVKK